MTHQHRLWIDTVAERLGRSPRTAIFVLGVGSYIFFIAMYVAAGAPAPLLDIILYGLIYFVPLVFAPLAASVYVRDKMVSLEEYAISMVDNPESAKDLIAPLSDLRGVSVVALAISVLFVLPYLLQATPTDRAAVVLETIPWLAGIWFMATTTWTLGYSLVGVYRIGKLPMTLRPFTADRSLGLRPFASTCLRLTAIYYGLVSFTIITDLEAPLATEYVVLRTFGFAFLGLILFLLPLSSLHKKLLEAKTEKIRWINERYSRLVQRIESVADGPLDPGIQGELLAIDKLQRDIHSIQTWPLNVASVAKLITIFLSVIAILLSRFIAPFLGI